MTADTDDLVVELLRFRVRDGAMPQVRQWMAFLRDHESAVLETLEPERMMVESVFHEQVDGVDHLTWYCVRGRGGRSMEESDHWLDVEHRRYWASCIDTDHRASRPELQVSFMPERVRAAMRPVGSETAAGTDPRRATMSSVSADDSGRP